MFVLGGTLYYILSVGGMVIVRCTKYRGCPLLGGSLSINATLNFRVIEFVRCIYRGCPLLGGSVMGGSTVHYRCCSAVTGIDPVQYCTCTYRMQLTIGYWILPYNFPTKVYISYILAGCNSYACIERLE